MKNIEKNIEDFSRISNSWAVGDIEELERLKFSEVNQPCKSYYDSVMGFQKKESLASEQDSSWISVAERTLSSQAVTIAVLPLYDMLKPGGYLEVLRSKGTSYKALMMPKRLTEMIANNSFKPTPLRGAA